MHCFANTQTLGAPSDNAYNQAFLELIFRPWFHLDIRINFIIVLHVFTSWENAVGFGGLAFINLLSLIIYLLVNYPVFISYQLDQVY